MAEHEVARDRKQLAVHVRRMRIKGGCTFEEIARAIGKTVAETRKLWKEATR